MVAETYPRYVVRRLWPELGRLPSKRAAPAEYVELIYSRLREDGYECVSVVRPTVDQVDAMVCALAAESCRDAAGLPEGSVGERPALDRGERVLREGFIVSP